MNKTFRSLFIILSLIISHNVLSNPIPSGSALSIIAPVTITVPGNYTLSNDIMGTITIATDDVDLNLNNKTISGNANGIEVTGQQNITIRNGNIENANINGLRLDTVANVGVYNVDFVANATGVFILSSTCVEIEHSTLSNQTAEGVCLGGASENVVITHNKILNNQRGIIFLGTIKSVVAYNLINQNDLEGVLFAAGVNDFNTVEYNKIIRNALTGAGSGIGAITGNFNTYAHNIIKGTEMGNGIFLTGVINNVAIIENESSGNGTHGISLAGGVGHAVVKKNLCQENTSDGINVDGSSDNTITENICSCNLGDGFNIGDTSGTRNITKFNWAVRNTGNGFFVDDVDNTTRTFSNHSVANSVQYAGVPTIPNILGGGVAPVTGFNLSLS